MVQDVLAWSSTKNGRYNVKFRYHVAKKLRLAENNCGEALMQTSNTSLWSRIWKAKVPNKIRIFSWRACHNILPTKDKIWCEGGCWRMLGVVSVKKLMNRCCMYFGSVGQHKTFGLAVQLGFKKLVRCKWILGSWLLVSCRGCHMRSWIYFR